MKKILITGKGSYLGNSLKAYLARLKSRASGTAGTAVSTGLS